MTERTVPRRQWKEIDSELDIYFQNIGGGVNRKPYNTDEFQLFKDQLEQDAKDNELLKKNLPKV